MQQTDPRTKEQFLNRILSYDFDGDLSAIGEDRALIDRVSANRVAVRLPATGQLYEIVVRKPRIKSTRKRPSRAAKAAPALTLKRHAAQVRAAREYRSRY